MKAKTIDRLEVIYYLSFAALTMLLMAALSSNGVSWWELGIVLLIEAGVLVLGRFVVYHRRGR